MRPNHRPEPTRRRALRALLLLLPLHFAAGAAAATPLDPPADSADAPAAHERLAGWRRGEAGVQILEPLLAERLERLRAEAPSFARAWEELERSGVPVVIGTREQVEAVLPGDVRRSRAWAGITVSWGGRGGELLRSAVGIRLEWLRELHRSYGNSEADFLKALDGLLVHEVYGHLAPVVKARHMSAFCADPSAGERLAESCVGRRELALNRERKEHLVTRLTHGALADDSAPQY